MRNVIVLVIFSLIASLPVQSQGNTIKITGTVVDATQKAIQSATVSLVKEKDSSVIKFAVTNKNGEYEFDVLPGNYRVMVTSVGYNKKYSDLLQVSSSRPAIKIDPVLLAETSKGLGDVTITSKKPFIETKIDKTVVNVDASLTSAGSTAMEVLEKSPGIIVNNDGSITLKGKPGVIVMMDGKPSYLSPADLANLLKNLPASAIDQIEIMSNPSSKYDASGNSGIINIKTKKGKLSGFNGSVMTSFTESIFKFEKAVYLIPRTQNSINFNYRKNKLNFFGNYNPNINRGQGGLIINRRYIDDYGNLTGYSDVVTKSKYGNNNHTLKLGLDYYADAKNTYGVVVSGFAFFGHPTPVTTTTLSDANHEPYSTLVSLTQNHLNFKNLSANFNYRHVFDSLGREWTVDMDYIGYNNTSNMLLTTNFYDGAGQSTGAPLLLQNRLPSLINIYSFKSDYTQPFKKTGRLEAGIKSSYVKNDNLVAYNRLVQDKWVPDNRSNHFVYDENINAAYINLNTQVKKWSFQGGLRLENTIAKGHQITNDSTFKRNFTNLFPSAFISYAADKNNTLTFSYSRRITRPNYQDLNPFTYFLDSLSYFQGNPYLLSQFTHNFELSHSYKGKFITSLDYSSTTDVIAQILKQDVQTRIVFATSDNVASFRNFGISVTAPLTIAKWWNLTLFTNIFNNHYTGMYNADPIDISYTSFQVNVTNSFTIKPGFTGEISGWYRAKGVDQLSISEPMYQMSVAGQKQILKGKGTLRLNIRDPFAWQVYKAVTQYGGIDLNIYNRFNARQVTVSFTYRFGKSTQQGQPRRRSNATQDEQNRVGQGQ